MASVTVFRPTVVRSGVKTKSKVWWMAWRDDSGKLRRQSTKAREKSVATRIAREHERQLLLDPLGLAPKAAAPKPWTEFTEEMLEHSHATSRSRTGETYRLAFQHFAPIANSLHVHEITVSTLHEFVRLRRSQKHNGEPISPATINKDLRGLRAAMNHAVERGYIVTAPKFKTVFLREDRPSPVVIPRDQQAKMYAALDSPELVLKVRPVEWWRVFLMVIDELGVRRGEALGIRWSHVDFRQQQITVEAVSSKGRRYRILPISESLAAALQGYHGGAADTDHVLPWPKSAGHIRRFYDDWRRILATAGLPRSTKIVPKAFRSTAGSEMIEAGAPTVVVKDFLGHASVTTTEQFYISTGNSVRAAAVARAALDGAE